MQEVLPVAVSHNFYPMPNFRKIGRLLIGVLVTIWMPVRWLLEVMFTPHPGQRYIEENRIKAIRFVGHL